jgi:hypothetical protein
MSFHKDLLEEMISSWTDDQLGSYIIKLELREVELHTWLKELRRLRTLRKKKPVLDTGNRHD